MDMQPVALGSTRSLEPSQPDQPSWLAVEWSDGAILAALRAAAALVPGRLSAQRYGGLRHRVGGPSAVVVLQRFGTWRAACEAAGIVKPASTAPARSGHPVQPPLLTVAA
jgi:hypothetical protein